MKKIVSTICILFLLFSIPTYADNRLEKLQAFKIIEKELQPQSLVNREKFAKIIIELLGEKDSLGLYQNVELSDVNSNSKYKKYIDAVIRKDLMSSNNGKFSPKKNLNVNEAITVIIRLLGYNDEILEGKWPSNYIIKGLDLNLINKNIVEKNELNYKVLSNIITKALETNVLKKELNNSRYFISY